MQNNNPLQGICDENMTISGKKGVAFQEFLGLENHIPQIYQVLGMREDAG